MKAIYVLKKLNVYFFLVTLMLVSVSCQQKEGERQLLDSNDVPIKSAGIYYDSEEDAIFFAAGDLMDILQNMGVTATLNPLSDLGDNPEGSRKMFFGIL